MAEKPSKKKAKADKAPKKKGGFLKKLLFGLLGLGLAGGSAAAVMFFFYQQGTPTMEEGDVPLVEADDNPFKVKPDNPEGMEFAHRDSTAYNAIDGNKDGLEDTEISIQDPPDLPATPAFDDDALADNPYADDALEPLEAGDNVMAENDPAVMELDPDSPEALAMVLQNNAEEDAGVIEASQPSRNVMADPAVPMSADEVMKASEAPASDPLNTPAPLMPEPTKNVVQQVEKPMISPVQPVADEAPSEQSATPQPAPEKTTSTPERVEMVAKAVREAELAAAFRIQLGSLRSKAVAEREWARLSKKNNDLLGGLRLLVQRADLGDRGVFYRVQAGPMPSEAEARALCKSLESRNVGCLIVRP